MLKKKKDFAIETGVRVGELCAMKWEDIKIILSIFIPSNYQRNKKGGTEYYLVPYTKNENGEWIKKDAYITFLRRLCQSKNVNVTNVHIKNLDDKIDNFMNPKEKKASQAIQDVTGIGNTSAQAIISVIGTDMKRFPTDKHISSWAGLCPGDNESAKKRKSGKTRKGNALLRLIN